MKKVFLTCIFYNWYYNYVDTSEYPIYGKFATKISGEQIRTDNVCYKNADGNLFNHSNYLTDPYLSVDSNNPNNPYKAYFSSLIDNAISNSDGSFKQPFLFTRDGEPLCFLMESNTPQPYYFIRGTARYETVDYGNSKYTDFADFVTEVITTGEFKTLRVDSLFGNDVYAKYGNTGLPITGNATTGSKLLKRNGATYDIVPLSDIRLARYREDIGWLARNRNWDNVTSSNGDIRDEQILHKPQSTPLVDTIVDTRATCFNRMLQNLNDRGYVAAAFSGSGSEIYAPYILNRIGRCVTITHAPDVNLYSIINFGDGTTPVTIFTDLDMQHLKAGADMVCRCWRGEYTATLGNRNPNSRPDWGGTDNIDAILSRMRDYRATHHYTNNGTYTITIESFSVDEFANDIYPQNPQNGVLIVHDTTTYNLTVTDANSQDIIYFKVPKQFDHIYINGVRCPTVEQANDYNVVGLDVTGYNWLLGKICAGRRDVILCKLPLLSTTSYTKYQCYFSMSRSGGNTTAVNYTGTFDLQYDAKSGLYYVDDLATKTSIADITAKMYGNFGEGANFTIGCTVVIRGVAQDDSTTELVRRQGLKEFPAEYIFEPSATSFNWDNTRNVVSMHDGYYNWQPYFARSSIQVAEFENDYVRNTTDDLGIVRGERTASTAKFMSDYSNLSDVSSAFGNDAILPLADYHNPTYRPTYTAGSGYIPSNGTTNDVVILTEACIGKTYDLRNVIPWKTFFPGCYCNNAPLTIYN